MRRAARGGTVGRSTGRVEWVVADVALDRCGCQRVKARSGRGRPSVERAANLPAIRLHDMRHSYATAGLAAGVPPKVMSERLVHATVAFTLDTHTSARPAMDKSAADVVAELILGTEGFESSGFPT
jgi:hypothetical protein